MIRGAGLPAPAAAFVMRGTTCSRDGALVGHPQDRPRRLLAGDAQHHRGEGREQDRVGATVRDVHRAVHAVAVVLDVHRARAREGRVQDLEVVAHQVGGPLVRETELALDDPVVRHAEAEREAPLAHRLVRQHLLRHGDRMTGLDRQDRGPQLDPLGRAPHQRDHGERVEVAGDLGHPDRGEAGLLGRLGVGDQLRDLVAIPPSLRADHQADPHPGLPSDLGPFAPATLAAAEGTGNSILILRECSFQRLRMAESR